MKSCEVFLRLSFDAAAKDICQRNLPAFLLTDIFECNTLSSCEKLFTLVEDRVDLWKQDSFFKHVKNQLLRACNDLLRRLSRSQNTVFCGRILVFLARFFPLFERSGLNLISEFNHDNVITIALQDEGILNESGNSNELEEGEMPTETIDYNLYRKFWQLQEMFRSPNSCYSKNTWKLFQSYTNDVLTAFNDNKLDAQIANRERTESNAFFSKYLTNQKLLELQLADSNFRRYILLQFLITFQYLSSSVKFKQDSMFLDELQTDWVRENLKKVFKLLEETHPNGKMFRYYIQNIFSREEHWSEWKNDGCIELKPSEDVDQKPAVKKRRIGDELRETGRIDIGNAELSRLWNLCPDNWEACRSQQRIFTPTVEKFFEDVIHSSDDVRQKKIQDDNFSWRALRLLSQKSSHFFLPSNQMVKPLHGYLDTAMEKLSKDLAVEIKTVPDLSISDAEDISDDELLKQVDDLPTDAPNGDVNAGPVAITKAAIAEIAEHTKHAWKELAPYLFKFEVSHCQC